MNIRVFRIVALVALVCFSFYWTSLAQNSRPNELTITGRVTMNGQGLSGVSVVAWKQPSLSPNENSFVAKTSADGKYQLKLPLGIYFAAISDPTFFEMENGKASLQLRALTVTENEVSSDFDFEVGQGGLITGRITDASNQPLTKFPVNLISVEANRPAVLSERPPAQTATRVRTDGEGIYRLVDVVPGRYRLVVGDTVVRRGQTVFKRMFFPGTFAEAKATILEITPGTELTGFDVKMPLPESTFTVRARIVDEATDLPVVNINCALDLMVKGKVTGVVSGQYVTNQNGECAVENVAAGYYRVYVPSSAAYGGAFERNYYGRSAIFEVIDQDVEGVLVKAASGISVSGVVVIDEKPDQKLQAMLQNKQIGISSIPAEEGLRVSGKNVVIKANGTFDVDGLSPGRLHFAMTQPSESFPFNLSRIELLGVEQKEPIETKAGDRVTGLRLVLDYATGQIRGTARLSTGPFPASFKGVAMIYRNGKTYSGSTIDSRGQFMFQNVPEGNYRIVVEVGTEGPQRLTARSDQMIEVINDKVSDVLVILAPKQ